MSARPKPLALLALSLVLVYLAFPAGCISMSYQSDSSGSSVSISEHYRLDDSASMSEATKMDEHKLLQTRFVSGSGENLLRREIAGDGDDGVYKVDEKIENIGLISSLTSTEASAEEFCLNQNIVGCGDLSTLLRADKGSAGSETEATILRGVISTSQEITVEEEISAHQKTSMSGEAGYVRSGALSKENYMNVASNFMGSGNMAVELSTTSNEKAEMGGEVALDGATWLDDQSLEEISSDGVGMTVSGLKSTSQGLGTFGLVAVNKETESGQVGVGSYVSSSSEEDMTVLALDGGSPSSYELAGWKWYHQDLPIQMYLNPQNLGSIVDITPEEAAGAITAAANTWDEAVSENLFPDAGAVIIDPSKNPDVNPYEHTPDGYNVHAWQQLGQDYWNTLGYAKTYYYTTPGYDSAIESDVCYNADREWSTYWDTPSGKFDVQSVALHELGHTIGLDDLYDLPEGDPRKNDFDQIMNSYNGEQRSLGNGDETGAQELYGALVPQYVSLRSYRGQYVFARDGDAVLMADQNKIGERETFELVRLGDDKFALRAPNGKYVCAEGGGGQELVADRDAIKAWETFRLVSLPDNNAALQAFKGQYVCAEGGGGQELVADRDAIKAWETFRLVDMEGNSIALQAFKGQYVCAEGGGGRELVADRDAIKAWETFRIIDLGDNDVALRACNDQYVCAEGGGGRELVADRDAIKAWETFRFIDMY